MTKSTRALAAATHVPPGVIAAAFCFLLASAALPKVGDAALEQLLGQSPRDKAQQPLAHLHKPLEGLNLHVIIHDVARGLRLEQVQMVLLGKQRPLQSLLATNLCRSPTVTCGSTIAILLARL